MRQQVRFHFSVYRETVEVAEARDASAFSFRDADLPTTEETAYFPECDTRGAEIRLVKRCPAQSGVIRWRRLYVQALSRGRRAVYLVNHPMLNRSA